MYKPEVVGVETHINVYDGKLVIGAVAFEDYLESGGDMSELKPLADVILDGTIQIFPENFDEYPVEDNIERIKDYGQWLSGIVNNKAPNSALTREILDRAWKLKLGLHSRPISARFENKLWRFRQEAGTIADREPSRFASWTTGDYVKYAKYVYRRLKRKPTYDDFQRYWEERRVGPSGSYILKNFPGGLSGLVERIGFPDIPSWEKDDYIDHGVKFMRANPGVPITARRLNYLSTKKRGPSMKGVTAYFDSLVDYKADVEKEFYESECQRIDFEEDLLLHFKQIAEADNIMKILFDRHIGDRDKLLKSCMRYTLVNKFAPDMIWSEKIQTANISDGDAFAKRISNFKTSATQAIIETRAAQLGFIDYIWPFDGYMDYLKLPAEMSRVKASA